MKDRILRRYIHSTTNGSTQYTEHDEQCKYIPESFVLKLLTAGGLLPYSFTACTDQLYCVLCWRLVRGREVAVTSEKGREVEVFVRVRV